MKKTLFLLLVLLITCCFISCKKECVCHWGGIVFVHDDGRIGTGYPGSISFGKLSDTDCKNLDTPADTVRNEQDGITYYYYYRECQLQ
jgi:hypothetical protein